MTPAVAVPLAVFAMAMTALAADQSPEKQSDEPGALDIEPPTLKQNLDSSPSPDPDVARAERRLEHAKQNAAGVERLYRTGVLSKVEMELRLLRVVQCESDVAIARASVCKGDVATLEARVASGENARDELAQARATLTQLTEAARIALAKRDRAEVQTAETNLRRQQQLLKLGTARKSDVDRAEEKLVELKSVNNP